MPIPPTRLGYTFTEWSMSVDEIRAAIADTDITTVIVTAQYVKDPDQVEITVHYPGHTDYLTEEKGSAVMLTAPVIEGKVFLYWTDGAENTDNPVILGYNTTYYLLATNNRVITAIYGDEEVEVQPSVLITNMWAFEEDGNKKVSIEMTYNVPDGYTLVKAGFVRKNGVVSDDIGLDSDDVKVHVSGLAENYGVYVLTLRVGAQTGLTINIRGFIMVRNNDTGNIEPVIYSDQRSASYQDLIQ